VSPICCLHTVSPICCLHTVSPICCLHTVSPICCLHTVSPICCLHTVSPICCLHTVSPICCLHTVSPICCLHTVSPICCLHTVSPICCLHTVSPINAIRLAMRCLVIKKLLFRKCNGNYFSCSQRYVSRRDINRCQVVIIDDVIAVMDIIGRAAATGESCATVRAIPQEGESVSSTFKLASIPASAPVGAILYGHRHGKFKRNAAQAGRN
jgi:hypothetical protein